MNNRRFGGIITGIAIILVFVFLWKSVSGAISANTENNEPDYIEGDYIGYIKPKTDIQVTDGENALAAAAEIFGVDDDILSVTLEDGSERNRDLGEYHYRLQQMCGEFPVYGRSVNLSVDDGEIYLASGNLSMVDFPANSKPTISENDVLDSLYEYVIFTLIEDNIPDNLDVSLVSFDDESLCVYNQGEYEEYPCLAYNCSFTYCGSYDDDTAISGSYDAVVDANTAVVLKAISNMYTATEYVTYTNVYGNYDVELEYSGDTYIFQDKAHNLTLYDAEYKPMNNDKLTTFPEGIYSWDDIEDFTYYFQKGLFTCEQGEQLQPYTMSKQTRVYNDDDTKALRLFSNAQSVYDFYWQVLGRKGFNNGNGQMYLCFDHHWQGNIAYSQWSGNTTLLAFEWTADLNSLSLVGHEFTHSVERSISFMNYEGESGAIMEGYSDTLGVLAEAYAHNEEPTWCCAGRDLTSGKPFGGDYVHGYSYMISYPAYNIWNDWTELGIDFSEKIDDLANLYYRVLYLLEPFASYNQWYWAMEQVAQYMYQTGDLTQEQLNAVIDRIGSDREESEELDDDLELLKTVAVLLADEYEKSGETKLTDTVRELSSILLIPKIRVEMNQQVLLNYNYVQHSDDNEWMEPEEGYDEIYIDANSMFYYYAALFGEDVASDFIDTYEYYTLDGDNYIADYPESLNDICDGWSWEITKSEILQESLNAGYYAALVSPEGVRYQIKFLLSQDEGGYTGAFFNGYYLCDMGLTLDNNDELLLEWLEDLVEMYGVIEVGTEEYASSSGSFEHVVPSSRISGLLAAEMDDYDGDGSNELLVVRIEPDSYSTGKARGISKTTVVVEICDVADGEVVCRSKSFPVSGIPETEYQASAHVFKVTDGERIKLYFDHFFSFNSQTFATIQLEYIDGSLYVTDGAELNEYAYSASCYQAISDEACDTILGRQSYDIGQNGWEEYCSGYWDDYDDECEEVTWDTFHGYNTLLSGMGLTESVSRSMFWGDWDGDIYASLQAEYGRCCLKPVEHFTCDDGYVEAVCSLIAPYGQGSVTLSVEDATDLLYQYRSGTVSYVESTGSGDSTDDISNTSGSGSTHTGGIGISSNGYDSPEAVFYAFEDALLYGTVQDIMSLYADRQIQDCAKQRGCTTDYFRERLADTWEESLKGAIISDTMWLGLKEDSITELSDDDIEYLFGQINKSTDLPDAAVNIRYYAYRYANSTEPDYSMPIYVVRYNGRWYLSTS